MSKNFATISNDDLLEKVGDARHESLLKEFNFTEDTYPVAAARGFEWEIQTDNAGNVIAVLGLVESSVNTATLTWNNDTGTYDGEWNGRVVIVSGDVMSEARNRDALERFGVTYADADEAQTDAVDKECLDPFAWVDTDDNQATPFDSVTESMKEQLVEVLCADGDVDPPWTTQTAWQAAEDEANWEEAADGTIRPNVVRGSDYYI